MTVKLLLDWKDSRDGKQYKAGNLLTTDSYTENGLVASKQADTNLTGGTAYVAPTTQAQLVNLYGQVDPVTGEITNLSSGGFPILQNTPYRAKKSPVVICGGDSMSLSDFSIVSGSPTLSIVTGPNGKKALKIVTGVGVNSEISVSSMTGSMFGGEMYFSFHATYADGANQVSMYVSPDSYTNFALGVYTVLDSPVNSTSDLGKGITFAGNKINLSVTGSLTYPFAVANNKIRIAPQGGKSATVYLYAVGMAPQRKGRVCVVTDDGYDSWFNLGQPICDFRGVPVTCAVIPSALNTGGGYAWTRQLQQLVNGGGAVVAHGPNGTAGSGNLLTAYPGNTSAQVADMVAVRDWISSNALGVAGFERCYVWPQGSVQGSAYDMALLDGAIAAGFTTGRAAGGSITNLRNFDAENQYHHLFAQIAGHTWSGSTASEATNISNIVSSVNSAATNGQDIFLMFHRVQPTATADGSMSSIGIRVGDLDTIMAAVQAKVTAGTLEAVTLPQMATSRSGNFWQSI